MHEKAKNNDNKTSKSIKMQMNLDFVVFPCVCPCFSGLCHSWFIHLQPQTCKKSLSCKGQLKALATILALPSENVLIRAPV